MCFDLNTIRNIIRSWCGHSSSITPEEQARKQEERERTATARLEYLNRHTRPRSTPIDVPTQKQHSLVTQIPNKEDRRTDTLITDWRN